MRSTSLVRSATRPLFSAARAGPSTPAPAAASQPSSHATKAFLPAGQASAKTLDTLVSLHHSASGFMRDPSEMSSAFESAFRNYQPEFRSYEQFRAGALRVARDRGVAGLEVLAERPRGGAGARGARGDESAPGDDAQLSRDVFRARAGWTYRRAPASAELTERELRVKEALFGTWERGGDAAVKPGLEGVVDIVTARGSSVEQAAAEWRARDAEAGDKDQSTEDGM